MTTLHSNAALRVLRREMARINEAKAELIAAIDDPRIPAGVAVQQVQQCEREMGELVAAHQFLEDVLELSPAQAA